MPQSERTPFHPRSPYAVAKLYSFWATVNYREAYGMFAANGILFNHESPRRGENFVTRKITRAVAEIAAGRRERVALGNLDARRDWGFAGDFVEAMWLMLQADEPATSSSAPARRHSVREFAELAFAEAGMELEWSGSGVDEVGRERATGTTRVVVEPALLPAGGGRRAAGRPDPGPHRPRLDAHGELPRAGPDDGPSRTSTP